MHWYCNACNRGVAKLLLVISKLQTRQDNLELCVDKLRLELAEVKTVAAEAMALTKATETKLDVSIEAKLVEGVDDRVESKMESEVKVIREDVEKKLEIDKCRNNLIFHGVKEGGQSVDGKDAEVEMIEEILKVGLKLDASRHIEEVSRIGNRKG